MTNQNGKMPPVTEFDNIIPQSVNTTNVEKNEKMAYNKRNYLDFSIPEGQKTREITIRLLPVIVDDDKPHQYFQIVHLHSIPVNKELKPNKSGKKAYMCLSAKNTGIDHEKYGSKCPVCEAQQDLWKVWHNETEPSKKKEILKAINELEVREYCIVRCIERGKEDEGPKFWRIPLRQDQTDAYHKIMLLAKQRHDEGKEAGIDVNIFCPYNGRDLTVTFSEGTGAPTIIDKGVSTPITRNEVLLSQWYYDEKKWSDVFSTKSYDYLKVAFEGDIPWFDKENNRWVNKNDIDDAKIAHESEINGKIESSEKQFTEQNIPNTPVYVNNNATPTPNVSINNNLSGSVITDKYDLPF